MSGDQNPNATTGYFDYFMVRSRRPAEAASTTLSGVIERLRTGEKRPFGSSQELLHLLEGWAGVALPPEAPGRVPDQDLPGDEGPPGEDSPSPDEGSGLADS